jgi:hypothetical protein
MGVIVQPQFFRGDIKKMQRKSTTKLTKVLPPASGKRLNGSENIGCLAIWRLTA